MSNHIWCPTGVYVSYTVELADLKVCVSVQNQRWLSQMPLDLYRVGSSVVIDKQTCCCSNILDTIMLNFPATESGFSNMTQLVQPKHFALGALTPHPSITCECACFMSHKIKQNPVLVVIAKSIFWLYLSDGKLHFLFSSPTMGTWISIT